MRLPGAFITASFFLLALAARADDGTLHQGQHEHQREQLLSGAQVLAARDAYLSHCAACHGEMGRGKQGATDFSTPAAVARLSRADMVAQALNGHARSGAAAPPALPDREDAERIVDYIRDALMLPAPLADASLGRRIYAGTCSVCHGERGNGASWAQNSLNPAPFDFTSSKGRTLSRQQMIHSVTFGRRGTAMMPFATQLSRDEIAAVVDYVRSNFIDAARPAAPEHQVAALPRGKHAGHGDHAAHGADGAFDPHAPFPAELSGDIVAGKTFYDGNCAECHGLKGDGEGRRAYFMNPKPADFTAPEARTELNRPHLFEAIAKGVGKSEMPAWSKVLNEQQIANVAEYVFQAFIQDSGARSDPGGAGPAWHQEAAPDGSKKKF